MEHYKIIVLSSLFKETIMRDLISLTDLSSLLSNSDTGPNLQGRILDRVTLMLDLAHKLNLESPTAQVAIKHLTVLLDDSTLFVRQLANNLLCHISRNTSHSEFLSVSRLINDSGAINRLSKLLSKNRDEYLAVKSLESLFSNKIIAESIIARSAIEQLANYLTNPLTRSSQGTLFCSLALGNIFQCKNHARSSQAVRGVRALMHILQEGPSEDLKSVVLGALQNVASFCNGEVILESGGVKMALEIIKPANKEVTAVQIQAAVLLRLVFEKSDVSEFATVRAVGILTAALETQGEINEYLQALKALFTSLPSLTLTQKATSSIPRLVSSLRTDSKAAQKAALDSLFLIMKSWISARCPIEVRKAQSVLASKAIPSLQMIVQFGPDELKNKAMMLLRNLPGVLTIVIEKGGNFQQKIGKAKVYCKVKFEGLRGRKTGVLAGPAPQWYQEFKWKIASLKKDMKMEISCKNKSLFGKGCLGKIEVRPECAMLGAVYEGYALPKSKSGASRFLGVKLIWSCI